MTAQFVANKPDSLQCTIYMQQNWRFDTVATTCTPTSTSQQGLAVPTVVQPCSKLHCSFLPSRALLSCAGLRNHSSSHFCPSRVQYHVSKVKKQSGTFHTAQVNLGNAQYTSAAPEISSAHWPDHLARSWHKKKKIRIAQVSCRWL